MSTTFRLEALEPAWGANCLSCHGLLQSGTIRVFGEDTMANPDESGTGAPDRGFLKTFQTFPGKTKTLLAEVVGLEASDTYAVALERLKFPGVEHGGQLRYTGDCGWPEWGEHALYYTDPVIAHAWPTGPTSFSFDIQVGLDADRDYYDLVFAVAGRVCTAWELFYAEEHFYLHVWGITGDLNCDGVVDFDDINPFILALVDKDTYELRYPQCNWLNADCNEDGAVDFADINPFIRLLPL